AEVCEARIMLSNPVAHDDAYSGSHDHTLNSGTSVLSNDQRGGPGTLTAVQVTGTSHGSLTLHSSGIFSYVPNALFVGTDSFTYKDYDGTNYSLNNATVTITVSNSAPTTTADSYAFNKDTFDSAAAGASSLLANDSDSDGDTLTASLVTGPSHGSVVVH